MITDKFCQKKNKNVLKDRTLKKPEMSENINTVEGEFQTVPTSSASKNNFCLKCFIGDVNANDNNLSPEKKKDSYKVEIYVDNACEIYQFFILKIFSYVYLACMHWNNKYIFKDTILKKYKIWRFEDPHFWLVY